ncbi:MAG: type II secretion system F family protein [Corynebacterium sp.]|uniref:type II secretion system F family protein n=1 Tax=Corynebacterium sp. TaxID=1720 RepID=UPI0026DB2D4C|nr:type II secretion system F family protein [Corynebacterium sp.]MDO5030812.1 type II secretion system F family protein [Corynebacterium sp.]
MKLFGEIPSSATLTVLVGFAAALVAWPDGTGSTRTRALAQVGDEDAKGLAARWNHKNWVAAAPHLLIVVPAVGFMAVAGIPGLVAGALLGRTAGAMVKAGRTRRGGRREAESAAEALETITAQLRAGVATARALEVAAAEVRRADGTAVADQLAHAARRAHFADPWDDLEESSEELQRIGRAWQVAQRRGLSLAGLLDCVRGDVRARQAHRSQAQAALAGPRMTIAILASLPVFGLVMGQAFGAAPVSFLSHGLGGVVLVVGVVLVCVGLEWSVSIIDRAEAGR